MPAHNRVWAKIDLNSLICNYRLANETTARPAFAVIKADAYGHGAVEAAYALSAYEAQRGREASFAVATVEEALRLRRHHIQNPILLLGAAPADFAQELSWRGIAVSVTSLEHAAALSRHMQEGTLLVHIKLETGMNRCGVPHSQDILKVFSMDRLRIGGLYTHLCVADDLAQTGHTRSQIAAFTQAADFLRKSGLHVMRHVANSAAIIAHPEAYFDAVRPGVMLYGHNPCAAAFPLQPVMSIHAQITQVKSVAAGEPVGYGCAWEAPRNSRIAVVPIGYADGLFRALSGKIDMLVHGQRARQVGRICMDMCMLDVTDIKNVRYGDTVTILGEDGDDCIRAEELADLAGTIPYEIFCAVGLRVPRRYYNNGILLNEINYVSHL